MKNIKSREFCQLSKIVSRSGAIIPIIIKNNSKVDRFELSLINKLTFPVILTRTAATIGTKTNHKIVDPICKVSIFMLVLAKMKTKNGTVNGLNAFETDEATSGKVASPPKIFDKKTELLPTGIAEANINPKNNSSLKNGLKNSTKIGPNS